MDRLDSLRIYRQWQPKGVYMKIKNINPIAKALLSIRKQVVPSKKGKGSYNRKKEKNIAKQI